ncbi:SDR family NAD(P)-dependent oxidoreductase [Rhizobium sp. SEMIA 4085]|uniref:Short-chain dehydrogenase/reductase SDR family protein n=1 Tax=Rhizobium gallicum bv. gallicum R602sp TaxID=1041138 RepID=A0A0B4XE36_9HYPH|nr:MULTISPECIES: SDR family NAD(P)-dependent oxidoreductase [Rhizobium]AJD45356.1 short-chain dehydrogenase/reductase SDR family protein [Rhizobium gallicum bv. gallicum R602sp]NNH32070.1 SDR family NAD(P)-dependent oxidoreductase [Rhizobium sp. SEMIA 4085]TDW27444.1 NADP-dependent 3-hydroxy acid dehydrogenase YdfG [Rhizobium azibense]
MEKSLKGRVAVVTGAAGGIGQAIVSALGVAGVTVHALTRGGVPPSSLSNGASISWHHVDLADDRAIAEFVARLRVTDRGIDYLVHSAGVFCSGPVAQSPVEELDNVWRVNLRAPYVLTQLLLPALARQKGYIAFINSSVWLNPRMELAGYTMSKYALKAFADVLRAEINNQDVRVLSIFPGKTATPMQETIHDARALSYQADELLQPESVAANLITALSMPSTCEVTEIFMRPARPTPPTFND